MQCFITRSNTEKRVENTTRSRVFSTNFEVFNLLMKHCVKCLILLLKQNDFKRRKDAKMGSFFLSDFQTLTKH